MKKMLSKLAAVACTFFLLSGSALALEFNDFSDTSLLTLSGDATTPATADGTVLRLTSATSWESGSAFSSTTVNAATFSTFFEFRITDPGGVTDGTLDSTIKCNQLTC